MKTSLVILTLVLVPVLSVAHEQSELEVTTPTKFSCNLELKKTDRWTEMSFLGIGNCRKGDLMQNYGLSFETWYLGCDMKTIVNHGKKDSDIGLAFSCLSSGVFITPRKKGSI